MVVCGNCKREIPLDARFCPYCGYCIAEAEKGVVEDIIDTTGDVVVRTGEGIARVTKKIVKKITN